MGGPPSATEHSGQHSDLTKTIASASSKAKGGLQYLDYLGRAVLVGEPGRAAPEANA